MSIVARMSLAVLLAASALAVVVGSVHAAPDPSSVGIVTDIGGLNDRSFNALTNLGLERAESRLEVTGTVLESRSHADYAKNLGSLVDAEAGLVFGIGFLMGDAVKEAAATAPETKFAIVDYSYADGASWDATTNVAGILFNERQAGYMAGALAGAAERNSAIRGLNRARVVSAIGGQDIPPVTRYMGGFRDGVHRTCPRCRVLMGFSNDFIDQAKCQGIASRQIRLGSDIVFVVAGGCGLGALDEVRTRGVWGIGVDADQAYLGPHMLTSAIKRVDVAVYDLITRHLAGTFPGGTTAMYGVARNGVGIGRVAAPARRYQFAVDAALRDLKNGTAR